MRDLLIKKILLRAADICERGWSQRAYARDEDGERVEFFASIEKSLSQKDAVRFCAGGAIYLATSEFIAEGAKVETAHEVFRYLARHLCGKEEPYAVIAWNDAASQTQENVVQTMRAAAEAVR